MSVSVAEQCRQRKIFVPVPGTDVHVECRQPQILDLLANNVVALETYSDILAIIATWQKGMTEAQAADSLAGASFEPRTWIEFRDLWVTLAAVTPKIVLTQEEEDADPTTWWIGDVPDAVRMDIFQQTCRSLKSPRLRSAVTDFRRLQSAGPVAGPDGAPVRDETV